MGTGPGAEEPGNPGSWLQPVAVVRVSALEQESVFAAVGRAACLVAVFAAEDPAADFDGGPG